MSTTTTTTTRERALELLGYGAGPEQVAAACGVEVSTISKLTSDAEFSAQVAELRFQNLAKHNARDGKLDRLEDELIEKLDTLKDMIYNPMQVLKALQIINAAKRRGTAAPDMITAKQTVITLNIPTVVLQKFTTNVNNQVIQAGNQELVTIPSAHLVNQVKKALQTHGTETPKLLPAGAD